MRLRYTPAAIFDLDEIDGYIRDTLFNPEAADRIILRIADACALLKEQPYMGGELSKKLDRDIDGRFLICEKYIVIYDVGEAISILRVLDTRTDYMRALIADLSSR